MSREYSLSFLTVADVSPVDYPILNDSKLIKETRVALDDTGVRIADVEIVRITSDFEPNKYLQFLSTAEQLGARHILVTGNDPEQSRLIHHFAQFCELSKQFGLSCDLEFMPWTNVKNLAQAEYIVNQSGQENAAILIDALHFDRSDSTLEQIKALDPKQLNYVQLCDGFAEYDPSDEGLIKIARSNRLVPGQGEIDLVGLIRALPKEIMLAAEVPNLVLAERPALERAEINLQAMKQLVALAQLGTVTG